MDQHKCSTKPCSNSNPLSSPPQTLFGEASSSGVKAGNIAGAIYQTGTLLAQKQYAFAL